MSAYDRHVASTRLEICVGSVGYQTEPHTVLLVIISKLN